MVVHHIGSPHAPAPAPRPRAGEAVASAAEPSVGDTFAPSAPAHPAVDAGADAVARLLELVGPPDAAGTPFTNVPVVVGRLMTLLLSPASVLERGHLLREVLGALARRDAKAAAEVERTLRTWLEEHAVLPVDVATHLFGERFEAPKRPDAEQHPPRDLKARAVMTREVVWVAPTAPLRDVHAVMQQMHIRHVPVVEGGRLVGVLSDRDVALHTHLASDGARVVPMWSVSRAMTPAPIVCTPETTVAAAARTMLEHKFDCLPVVTLGRALVGIVTSADLLELLCGPEQADRTLPYDFKLRQVIAA